MQVFYGDHNKVPQHAKAKTAQALHKKLAKLQFKNGVEYKFISFYFDSLVNEHVAWYYTILNENEQMREAINGITNE